MKFTLAAGILAQTLPVISETILSSFEVPTRDENQDADLVRFLASRHKKQPKPSHRALTVNARRARLQARMQSGNQLTNMPPLSSSVIVQCDPSLSDDADVGILSCGPGSECVINKQEGASLGGVCVQTSRSLQEETTGRVCDFCDFGFTLGGEHYDTVLDIPEVGYEGTTGLDLINAAYINKTMDEKTCSVVTEAVRAAGFCEAVCDLCGWASYVPPENYNITLEISGSGYEGATCGDLSFASYVNGTIATTTCPAAGEVAKSAGCCRTTCTPCGFGVEIPDDPFPSSTCEDLHIGAYGVNKTFLSEEDCAAAIQLAETEGCCAAMPTYDCNVCGDATFYPDNAVFKFFTCEETVPFLNDTLCATYTPKFAPFCCGSPSEGSAGVPTSAPQETPPSEPGAPSAAPDGAPSSPTSTSATMWSTSTVVSLMGLTAATTAGAFMLN